MPSSTSKLKILGLALLAALVFNQLRTAQAEIKEPNQPPLPIRIASWAPENSPWALWGEGLAGIQAMVNFVNTYGGLNERPLELIVLKHGDPAHIKKRLDDCAAENNPVTAVVGGRFTASPATADMYYQSGLNQVPWLGPWHEEEFLYQDPANPTFGLLPTFEEQLHLMAAYLAKQPLTGKVIFIHGSDPYGLWSAQKAQKLSHLFQEVGGLEIWPHQDDYNQGTAARLAQQSPLAVILWLPPTRATLLLKNSPHLSTPKIIWFTSALTATNSQLLSLSEGYWDQVMFPAIIAPNDHMTLRYSNSLLKHGPQESTPGYQALVGFGSAQILVRALKQAGTAASPDELSQALYSLSGYQTILPPLNYTPRNHQLLEGYYLATTDKESGRLIRVWP